MECVVIPAGEQKDEAPSRTVCRLVPADRHEYEPGNKETGNQKAWLIRIKNIFRK
jgi:hypothetical protein